MKSRMLSLMLASFALAGALTVLPARPGLAAEKSFTCNPTNVAIFKQRIHVRCAPGDGAIQFFAVSTGNVDEVNRFLSLAATAVALRRQLSIFYDPADTSGANVGCATGDCRLMTGLVMF